MRPDEAFKLSKAVSEAKEVTEKQAREKAKIERNKEIDSMTKMLISRVKKEIPEAAAKGEFKISFDLDNTPINWEIVSGVGSFFKDAGYKTKYDEYSADMGDSAAPCVIHGITLSVSWNAKEKD